MRDTGLLGRLPVGAGLVTFSEVNEARRGIEMINADDEHHRRAARRLAGDRFASDRVLPHLLNRTLR